MSRRSAGSPRRPGQKQVKVAQFGRYLESCRLGKKRRPSVEAVATAMREQGVPVDDATLRGYEYGWVEKPDPVILLGLAQFYRIDLHSLIAVLAANRKNKNLSDIELDRVLRDAKALGYVETAAAARLAEIKERIVDIGAELIEIAGAADVGGQTPNPGDAAPAVNQADRTDRR